MANEQQKWTELVGSQRTNEQLILETLERIETLMKMGLAELKGHKRK